MHEGEIYSSTRIREALRAGWPSEASELLGHPWEIEGVVEQGDRRGRTIGFPTANVALGEHLRPRFGVYAVRALVGGAWRNGVANLGKRPTVGKLQENFEVHVFDFAGDLYGQTLRVALIDFIRPEMKFAGLDALKTQIAADGQAARNILSATDKIRAWGLPLPDKPTCAFWSKAVPGMQSQYGVDGVARRSDLRDRDVQLLRGVTSSPAGFFMGNLTAFACVDRRDF